MLDGAALHASIAIQVEAVLLELFWFYVRSDIDRIELLRAYARQPVARGNSWDAAAIREQAIKVTAAEPAAGGCFGCRTHDRKLYWHHVLQIQHGASNHPRNRVAICYRCHASIHPWLAPNRRGELLDGEWWAFGDLAPADSQ